MKKTVSILVAMVMILSVILVPGYAFSDIGEGKQAEAITKLTGLDILKGYEDGTFKPENNITRAEFVAIMNRALGIDSLVSGTMAEAPFVDVPGSHWAAGDIKYASDNGMVAGYGEGYFGPEDNVTYEQALKIIYNAMGYGPKASTMGSYPDNYLAMAAQDGILRGITVESYAGAATRGNICSILYEAMQLETMEPVNYGGEDKGYQLSGTTLLEKLLKIKNADILEGIVTENHLTTLSGETTLDNGQVKITGVKGEEEWTLLAGETNAAELIGQRVEFHVDKDDSLAYPKITSITPVKNSYLEIEAEDITDTTGSGSSFTIEYETNDEKTRKANVGPYVVYNGRAVEAPAAEDLFIKNGKVKLIDNNQDNKYEVAVLSEYYSFRVEKVSLTTSVIFLKDASFNGLNRISLEPDEDDFYYSIVNVDGDALELEDIKEDDVITVLSDKDGKNIDLTVSKQKVEGRAEEYTEDDITIGGKTYKLAKDENGKEMVQVDLSKEGTFYIDTYGQVVSFEEGETLIENVGYVVSTKYEGGITEGFGMKLLLGGIAKQEQDKNDNYYYTTGNKEFKVLYTTGKVRLNGKSAGDEELNEKVQPGMLISFSLNKAGELTKIDLLDAEAVEAERAFNPDIGAFGGAFYIDDKTVVVAVPEEDTTDEDDYFTKVTLDKSKKYTTRGYEIDPETKVAKFAVVTTSMKADIGGTITSDADIMVVTRVYEKAEDADNVYCRIEGYQSGKLVNLTVKSEANVYTIANGLRQGDVIYYSLNSQDLVDNIEKVESLMPKPGYFHKDERGANERVFGKLHTIKRDELSETTNSQQSEFVINLATEESADQELVKMVVDTKNEPPVYLLNSKTGKVSVITLDDLFSTEEVGYEKATELFVCKKKFDVKGIIAVK